MNKKLLAKKILNFKKNKKNISEERSQLDEFLGMDLKTDKGLGDLQSALSTASAISGFGALIPGPVGLAATVLSPALSLGAYATAKARADLDRRGVVPSETSQEGLATQAKILGYGTLLSGLMAPGASTVVQNIPKWWGGSLAMVGRHPQVFPVGHRFAGNPHPLAGQLTRRGMGIVATGSAATNLVSTEWASKSADPIAKRLGLPNIPGLSKRFYRKGEYGTNSLFDLSRLTTLDLVAAANASRN